MARRPTKRRRWFGFRPTPASPPVEPHRFDEAVDFFRARVPMRKPEWLRLGTEARQRGFTVADVAHLDVLHDVWLALDDSIARGEPFAEFQKSVTKTLTDEWAGSVDNPPARIETIFRTNVIAAQNAGRHAQMTDPVVLERRPFWQYVDIDDQRECPICNAAHGTVLPNDDPWWWEHYPPQHYQCRCKVRPLTAKQAESYGVTISPSMVPSQDGFGAPPVTQAPPFEPDLSKYPPELAAIAREKMGAAGAE